MSTAVTELSEARALPRMNVASARALNRLYALGAHVPVKVRDISYRLSWSFNTRPLPLPGAFRFRLGAYTGQLRLGTMGQAELLDEPRLDLLPLDLRYILLADALGELGKALEKVSRVRFEWLAADDTNPPLDADAAVWFKVQPLDDGRAGFDGCIQFDDPNALENLMAEIAPEGTHAHRTVRWLDRLRVPLPFVLGTTQVRLDEVRNVCAGDIISIETWASSGAALLAKADLGGAGGCQLVGLIEGSRITIQQLKDGSMNSDPSQTPAAESDASGLPLDRLDALEVTLRFEVGDLAVTLGELRNIQAGHVFELTQQINRSQVRILAHGNVLGKGYLVAVGDRLGVRVSEFAPSEI